MQKTARKYCLSHFFDNEYLKSLAVKGFSENTIRVREIYIRMFLRWCETNGIVCANEITNETLLRFQEHLYFQRKLNGHPLSSSSQYSRLALIRLNLPVWDGPTGLDRKFGAPLEPFSQHPGVH